jgi:tRNA (mo5U34)-methyltransferase
MEDYDVNLMGDWHHDIAINSSVRTSHLSSPYDSRGYVNKEAIAKKIKAIYGDALSDKSVLDVACNAGGHLYALNRCGIKSGFGFDVRSMWIEQAQWVRRNIDIPCDNLQFVQGNFDVLNDLPDNYFNISLFNGIFYHLADPIAELAKVAAKTSELIIVNTAYAPGPADSPPALICKIESARIEVGLTGVDGLSWYPNGELVLYQILKHLGFPYVKLMLKNLEKKRLAVIASKDKTLL